MSMIVHAESFIPAGEVLSEVSGAVLLSRAKTEIGNAEGIVKRAEECVERAGSYLLAIRDGRKFRELGYDTFTSFLNEEFKEHRGAAWRKLYDAVVRKEVPGIASRSARELLRLEDGDKMRAADAIAKEIAGEKAPTAKHYREAAEKVAPEKFKPRKDSDPTGEKELAYRRERGDIPANAEAFVILPDPGAHPVGCAQDEPEDAELGDDDWLGTLEARAGLTDQTRKWFDADALYFRRIDEHRLAFVAACRPHGAKAKKEAHGHIGPFMARVYRYFQGLDPSRWKACASCKGSGQMQLIGQCSDCRGHGYHV